MMVTIRTSLCFSFPVFVLSRSCHGLRVVMT